MAIGAALGGRFIGGLTLATFGHDMQRLLLFRKVDTQSPSSIPMMRDYSAMVHIWMIGVMSLWAGEFLEALNNLIPKMRQAGSVEIVDETAFRAVLARTNQRLTKGEIHIGALAVAILLTLFGSLAYKFSGIYSVFTPTLGNAAAFSKQAYDQWWAQPFTFGSYPWLLWALVGNYVDIWVGYVSLETAYLFYKTRKLISFSISAANSDGSWGWGPAVALIGAGRKLAIAASIGLAAIALIANPAGYYYLVLFPSTFVVAICLFFVPNLFYVKARENFIMNNHAIDPQEQVMRSIQNALIPLKIVKTRDFIYQIIFIAVPGVLAIATAVKDALDAKS